MIHGTENTPGQMGQLQLQQQAQTSVMKSALDSAEQQGEALVNMIEESTVPTNAPLEDGKGQTIDLLA